MANFFTGSKGGWGQQPTVTPEQGGALSQMLQQAMGGLSSNKFDFAPIEQKARSDFQSKTLPGIRELFEGMGSGERSSAFNPAMASAGADLESNLASMRQYHGQQEKNSLMQMLQMSMHPQFENYYKQGQPGFLHSIMGPMGQGLMQGLGYGNPQQQGQPGMGQQPGMGGQQGGGVSLMKLLPMLLGL